MRAYLLFLVVVIAFLPGFAQVTDNTSLFRQINSQRYFRFHYDNDFFTKTDYYYTQGYAFELVSPSLASNPLTKLLPRPASYSLKFGLAFDHFGYTPTSISAPGILLNDRPYAACLLLKTFAVATDTVRLALLSSSVSIGAIGPVAAGKEIQTGIHKAINDRLPQGWRHQIATDVLLNYELTYERQLVQPVKWLLLSGRGQARLGTLHTKAQAGLTLMAGKFASPFTNPDNSTSRYQFYFYAQPLVNLVGYDASLQGGLINRSSPYTLSASDVERVTHQLNLGAVARFKKLQLEYMQAYFSKEFKAGKSHRWGGIRIAWNW